MSRFYDNAVRKVNQARNFLMKGGQRNFQGYLETANRILTSARNYESMGNIGESTFEPMAAVFRGSVKLAVTSPKVPVSMVSLIPMVSTLLISRF